MTKLAIFTSTLSIISLVAVLVLLGVVVADPNSGYVPPTKIHFAITPDPTSVIFGWHSAISTEKVFAVVHINNIATYFYGTQTSYLISAGYYNTVKVTGLTPGKTYTYQVGSEQGLSAANTFTAAPELGSQAIHRIAMYGDMGIFQYSYETVVRVSQLVNNGHVDMVYHSGDYGYGDDRQPAFYELSWDLFFHQMQNVMTKVPYMVTVGNHEKSCEHSECTFYSDNYAVYNTRFNNMPSAESGGVKSMWFSSNYGNVHFVTINTETDYPRVRSLFGDQMTWLEADLQAANENPNIDWIVVVGHYPMYSSVSSFSQGNTPAGISSNVQFAFEELFHKYNVDIYFCGHVHGYERSHPVYKTVPTDTADPNHYINPSSTVYIVGGNAGNVEKFYSNYQNNLPSWEAFRSFPERHHGFGVLEVNGASQLRWTQYANTEVIEEKFNNNVIDWFVIDRLSNDVPQNIPNASPPPNF